MENRINKIIEGVNAGEIRLKDDIDPGFKAFEYTDGPDDLYIVHYADAKISDDADEERSIKVLFSERTHVKEIRKKIYNAENSGAKYEKIVALEAELLDAFGNEYGDQFDYDQVAGYQIDGGEIVWC
ncbi:hypothetical protein MXL46_11760 [Heyndrickxia sporothermodurans]|uniref:hypothetical protein n=1 Tax=Heyndrickxia sporothermodurans TaxID=46224 RepID=UPI002DB704E6|nr:hypothetical protein [Heyndrickxia sporothermodurans]MEB6549762.1 hypothetical protein [Heyndrickxia sporothermodurans]